MSTPNTSSKLDDIDVISLLAETGLTAAQVADVIKKSKELSKTSTEINVYLQ